MLFKFLKYTNPINYFNLNRNDGTTIFPDWEKLPKKVKDKVILDNRFSTKEISKMDASWQAIQKGYIGNVETISFKNKIPIKDEYIFIRKYFSKIWVYYTFLIRILTFNNPFKELKAFYATKNIKKIDVYNNSICYNNWDAFDSKLINEQPKVSVIIPTLNRYAYLKDVLEDLEKQDYKNFDVIVIDQTDPFNKSFYDNYKLDLKVKNQKEKALWLARNNAIKMSDATYILLFDDDSRVDYNWISNHLKCLDFFKTNISSGTSISLIGAKVPKSYSYFKISNQIDTGNVMIKKSIFKKTGLFDRQFEKQRMGDGEYGLRTYLANILNISNPYAQRLHLKVGTGGLRQMGSWDGIRPTNWFAPRPIPSVLYYFRKYYGKEISIYFLLKTIPPSLIPYRYKSNSKMMFLGFILTIVFFPIVLLQVIKSWRLASIKLKQGDLIEKL